jgi:N-acetylglucosamine-6-phosphate deacetylase
VSGRLVLGDEVVPGRITIADGRIAAIDRDPAAAGGPFLTPGFCDIHVHGWGGHDAMGPPADLDGMARALLRRGVTSFLPTAVTAPLEELTAFAARVRAWLPTAPSDGAEPLGFNLEGPFIAAPKRGAHNPAWIRDPADVDEATLAPLLDGLRLITIAPEIPGALELIARLAGLGIPASLGHSAATLAEARSGYAAGARTTTHLFNAMSGVDHHAPGLAVAALTADDAWVELIADGHHVDRSLWPIVTRTKPADRLVLVSDALPVAGTDARSLTIGGLEIVVDGDRCMIAGTTTLAGSVIAVDTGVRNLVAAGVPLPDAVAAASTNPLALLGAADRGRIAIGQRADLVELGDDLSVRRVYRDGSLAVDAPA